MADSGVTGQPLHGPLGALRDVVRREEELQELQPLLTRRRGGAPRLRHVRHATVRLAELGAVRPVVRIPGRTAKQTPETARASRLAKLPPVWLLANVVILVFTASHPTESCIAKLRTTRLSKKKCAPEE